MAARRCCARERRNATLRRRRTRSRRLAAAPRVSRIAAGRALPSHVVPLHRMHPALVAAVTTADAEMAVPQF
ncbi:hypothetical protein MRX96_053903 [Rhipicephalus microplus]